MKLVSLYLFYFLVGLTHISTEATKAKPQKHGKCDVTGENIIFMNFLISSPQGQNL